MFDVMECGTLLKCLWNAHSSGWRMSALGDSLTGSVNPVS
jgi:hypothetical protein